MNLEDLQVELDLHRAGVLIRMSQRKDITPEVILDYIKDKWDRYSLCHESTCNAGEGCCHKFKLHGVEFCSPN